MVVLSTRLFTRYVRRHPSKKINTKKLPETGFLPEKNLRGAKDNRPLFLNNRLLFLLLFLLFFNILGGQMPFRGDKSRFGGAPCPPLGEGQ